MDCTIATRGYDFRKGQESLDDPVGDLRELTDFRTGRPFYFRRKDLIAIALNVGDEGENSNFQTLTEGYKWRADDVVMTLDQTLSEKEWEFVAEVYKLYAELLSQVRSYIIALPASSSSFGEFTSENSKPAILILP